MRREWTKQEETYLLRKYIRQPINITAEKLNRTVCSVKRKASRMGLSHYNSEFLNARTIIKSL